MNTPDRIGFKYNAADAADDFRAIGIEISHQRLPISEELLRVIASKIGRVYTLIEFSSEYKDSDELIHVRPKELAEDGVLFISRSNPIFEELYVVADNPPLQMLGSGDILFELVKPTK
jgi:hypothetical protein